MHLNTLKKILCCCVAVCAMLLAGCEQIDTLLGLNEEPAPTPTAKPQVTVEYGEADDVTLDLQEGVPTSYLEPAKFSRDGDRITYTDENMEVLTGIDVSEHQEYPEWDKIAADDIDFAMIRLGYRGSTEGKLYVDPIFRYNVAKAVEAGLEVGIYYFSQATSQAEAVAEAYFVVAMLEEYKDVITMPVVFDWEETGGESSRTAGLDGETVTDCAYHFTRIIREAGYDAGVYFNRHMGYYLYDLTRFIDSDVIFWFAGEGDYSDFYYEHSMWQYTFTGSVNGIGGNVDINLYVRPIADSIDNTAADENATEETTGEEEIVDDEESTPAA